MLTIIALAQLFICMGSSNTLWICEFCDIFCVKNLVHGFNQLVFMQLFHNILTPITLHRTAMITYLIYSYLYQHLSHYPTISPKMNQYKFRKRIKAYI